MRITKLHRIFTLAALVCVVPLVAHPQGQTTVSVEQSDDTVKIFFIINVGRPGDLCKVHLLVSSDGGLTFNIRPQMVHGIDRLLKVGQLQKITWLPLLENVELEGDRYVFDVVGEVVQISDNVEFVEVNGSTFDMGDSAGSGDADELPVHSVTISNFEMGQYEVTNRQFHKFLTEYKSDRVKSGEFSGESLLSESENGVRGSGSLWVVEAGYEDYPVKNVTWFGANEFCRHFGYRLPTEAEWEYAARVGGKKVKYGNGKDNADPDDINYNGSNDSIQTSNSEIRYRKMLTRVGIFPPNGLGLYDMSGNVWEWCQDWYSDSYYQYMLEGPKADPTGPWFGNFKVLRGGGLGNNAHGVRNTERSFKRPSSSNVDIGFRVVRK